MTTSELKIYHTRCEECIKQGRQEMLKEVLEIIDNMHELHIHTSYPCNQTKCDEPKKCYLNKRLQELKATLQEKTAK